MPPCDVWIAIEGHEANVRHDWEIARAVAFSGARFSMNGCKAKTPEKFWPFPWDKREVSNYKDIMQQHALKVAKRQALNKQNSVSS